jgi:hypothetical protein
MIACAESSGNAEDGALDAGGTAEHESASDMKDECGATEDSISNE